MEDPLSHSLKKEKGGFFTIVGDPNIRELCMFGKGVYLYVFYCFCSEMDVYTDMSEYQVSEERDQDLNEEEDIIMDGIRDDNWSDVAEEGAYKKKIHSLRWEIYVKEEKELIKIMFWCPFYILKGGTLFEPV